MAKRDGTYLLKLGGRLVAVKGFELAPTFALAVLAEVDSELPGAGASLSKVSLSFAIPQGLWSALAWGWG